MSSKGKKKAKYSVSASEIDKINCGHCHKALSKSQYQRHKQKYFNYVTKTWTKSEPASQTAKIKLYKCFHCGKHMGKTKYNLHKQKYYDTATMTWTTEEEERTSKSGTRAFIEDVPGSSSEGMQLDKNLKLRK